MFLLINFQSYIRTHLDRKKKYNYKNHIIDITGEDYYLKKYIKFKETFILSKNSNFYYICNLLST